MAASDEKIAAAVKKYGLSETQVGEFKEAFALFDKDNSGRISQGEFGKVMTSLGQSAPEPELKRMIGEVDLNTDGFIDLAEFMEMLGKKMRHLDNEEEIIEAFKIFDLDSDGQITGDEMQKSLSDMGEDLKREDIDAMIKYVSGGGESVDYEQFKAMMLNREVPAASS